MLEVIPIVKQNLGQENTALVLIIFLNFDGAMSRSFVIVFNRCFRLLTRCLSWQLNNKVKNKVYIKSREFQIHFTGFQFLVF